MAAFPRRMALDGGTHTVVALILLMCSVCSSVTQAPDKWGRSRTFRFSPLRKSRLTVSHGEVPSACTMLTAASQVNQSCTHEPYWRLLLSALCCVGVSSRGRVVLLYATLLSVLKVVSLCCVGLW